MAQEVIQAASVVAVDPNVQLVINKVEELCKALGLRAEQFFPYLLKQQEVIVTMGLVKLGVVLLLTVISAYVFARLIKRVFCEDFNPEIHGSDAGVVVGSVCVVMSTLAGVIISLGMLFDIPNLLGRLMNPTFYAMQDAMQMLGVN